MNSFPKISTLNSNGITAEKYMFMLTVLNPDYKTFGVALRQEGILDYSVDSHKYILTEKGKTILENINQASKERDASDLEQLVIEMRAFFPKGTKTGSSTWRGNIRNLCQRMMKFFDIYGNYTDEEILDATKRYVASFSVDKKYMRTLPYFIMKDETRKGGEETSDLANYLENIDTNNSDSSDWLSEVK